MGLESERTGALWYLSLSARAGGGVLALAGEPVFVSLVYWSFHLGTRAVLPSKLHS